MDFINILYGALLFVGLVASILTVWLVWCNYEYNRKEHIKRKQKMCGHGIVHCDEKGGPDYPWTCADCGKHLK